MKKLLCLMLTLTLNIHSLNVSIFGFINIQDGIGKISYSFIKCLIELPELRAIKHWQSSMQDLTSDIKKIINEASDIFKVNTSNDIIIYTNIITGYTEEELAVSSFIKLSYSMTECTNLPKTWVEKLNKYFDAVIVPDKYYVEVYKNSGINIPIFVLPMSLDLDSMLSKPIKSTKNHIFTFGYSAGFGISKNYDLLIDAFNVEFGSNPKVILRLHGLNGYYLNTIKNKIKNSTNIILDNHAFSNSEYINFLSKIDCYVTLSKGEGFSITPREAMALGIPCIISNNTAHKTICNSGFVYSVKSDIVERHTSDGKKFEGFDFNCTIKDARQALRHVYENYKRNLKKTVNAREWVKQYLPDKLRKKYVNLIFPKKIILSNSNVITDHYLMTNSTNLFKKYRKL